MATWIELILCMWDAFDLQYVLHCVLTKDILGKKVLPSELCPKLWT